jgi:RNA polymerase sigma-70 factor (ECF subfamily)
VTTGTAATAASNELEVALATDSAFQAWYGRTMPRVYSYLLSRIGDVALAEELTQQTFIAAVEQRWRFGGRSDAVTWLCAIGRHKLADHFRWLEREQRRTARAVVREIALQPPDRWSAVEEREAIGRSLAALPPAQRAVLIFVELDGLSVAEAARLLGRRSGATQSLLFRARESFRTAYRGEALDD